ncbi:MAG: hypothetical protein GY761_07235 [Hyphomicrobiales bacterium]|nr:hypothetical protein [Hyphomicrobiales bacterium]
MNRFRYSRTKFWLAMIVALSLTAMVTGLTWMVFTRLGNPNTDLITAIAGLIFLAFFSLRMALQYFRDEVVLAVLPTGINDTRWGRGLVEWELIKEILLRQRESEFELIVHLWPNAGTGQALAIDLDALEGDVETITASITRYMPIRSEY